MLIYNQTLQTLPTIQDPAIPEVVQVGLELLVPQHHFQKMPLEIHVQTVLMHPAVPVNISAAAVLFALVESTSTTPT